LSLLVISLVVLVQLEVEGSDGGAHDPRKTAQRTEREDKHEAMARVAGEASQAKFANKTNGCAALPTISCQPIKSYELHKRISFDIHH
jgi:hypothetical protein